MQHIFIGWLMMKKKLTKERKKKLERDYSLLNAKERVSSAFSNV
jgi:hypothetical protein